MLDFSCQGAMEGANVAGISGSLYGGLNSDCPPDTSRSSKRSLSHASFTTGRISCKWRLQRRPRSIRSRPGSATCMRDCSINVKEQ
jgi:hypothetical protein